MNHTQYQYFVLLFVLFFIVFSCSSFINAIACVIFLTLSEFLESDIVNEKAINIKKNMINKKIVFTGSTMCKSSEISITNFGNIDNTTRQKAVRSQIKAYFNSSFFLKTILKINKKKSKDTTINTVCKILFTQISPFCFRMRRNNYCKSNFNNIIYRS